MKITAPYRGRRASKRLDLTDLRAAFRDQRMWCSVGIVVDPGDGSPHFEVLVDDVHVEVILQPSLVPVTCRLSAGLWRVPDIGEEVMVQIPEGALEFMPTITDVLSSGTVPTTQGPAPGRTLIVRQEVVIHDGGGGAEPLVQLSQLQALHDAIVGWAPVPNDGGAALKAAMMALFSGPPAWPAGTTVLKGK